jgi:poly-gamma-glutamate synthesis protein (capsule biosynthesis protein)
LPRRDIIKISQKKAGPMLLLTGVGDVCLSQHFDSAYKLKKFNPWGDVQKLLADGICVANLESPITCYDIAADKEFTFKTNPIYVKFLQVFNIVNLANNHIKDFGDIGLVDTIHHLRQSKIQFVGADCDMGNARKIKIISKNGIKVAFLGYDDTHSPFYAGQNKAGTAFVDDETSNDIKKAKKASDIVCINVHWGDELAKLPNRRQIELAHSMIDAGADIIFGHHPHVIQPVRKYKNGIIYYSLGNFCFGGNRNPIDKDAIMAQVAIQKDGIISAKIIPVSISKTERKNNFIPHILQGNQRRRVLWKC